MADAAAKVPAPHSNTSLLNMWRERKRFTKEKLIGYGLSSVSDHAPFYQRAGVPCTYMLWMPNPVSLFYSLFLTDCFFFSLEIKNSEGKIFRIESRNIL